MPAEIELKLGLAEADHRRFLRLQELRHDAVLRESVTLINIYYDTPDLDLHRRGIALRLRKAGRLWLQTVKCSGVTEGGLSTRPEWEIPYPGHFDFGGISSAPVQGWLDRPKIRNRLLPVFETSFRRTTWTLGRTPARRVKLMFDRGWIAAAGERLPISELEIELQSGSLDQVFVLAERLAGAIPLMPMNRSKAERGYRLFMGLHDAPSKAASVTLVDLTTPVDAFRRIAFSCLEQLQSNQHGALATDDPEYIHQMRVALRRLRAALRLFRPTLPPDFEVRLLPALRTLMHTLGEVRDFDVLLAEITHPVSHALPDEPRLAMLTGLVTEARHASRQAALNAMKRVDHGVHLIQIARQVHRLRSIGQKTTPLEVFVRKRLHKLHRKMQRMAAEASAEDPASLHALRIAIKRLRYAIEFFHTAGRSHRSGRQLKMLVDCQDRLGQLNDLARAGQRLMLCAGEDPRLREAVTLIGGWHGARYQSLLDGIPDMLRQLQGLRFSHGH